MNGSSSLHRRPRAFLASVLAVALVAVLTACAVQIPADPDGGLDRITDGVLRVGASIDGDLVSDDEGVLSGSEADLIAGFAASRSSTIGWTIGSEESLVGLLEDGELDIVIGGMTDATPWVDRAGVTRGYRGIPGAGDRAIVMLVPLGENRLLSALEAFLDDEVGG